MPPTTLNSEEPDSFAGEHSPLYVNSLRAGTYLIHKALRCSNSGVSPPLYSKECK